MMEESKLEAEGNWWLPVSEYYQLPGTLSLNNTEGASLTIRGHFPVPIEIHSLRSKHDFIILGELSDGRKVTLIAYHILDQSENVVDSYRGVKLRQFEKLSAENPSFGKGVQVGILWKLKKNQHHTGTINRYTAFIDIGNYKLEYKETLLELKKLRREARYLEKDFVIAQLDMEKYLNIVNEMLELTQRLLV